MFDDFLRFSSNFGDFVRFRRLGSYFGELMLSTCSAILYDLAPFSTNFGDFVRFGRLGSDFGELALSSAILSVLDPISEVCEERLAVAFDNVCAFITSCRGVVPAANCSALDTVVVSAIKLLSVL